MSVQEPRVSDTRGSTAKEPLLGVENDSIAPNHNRQNTQPNAKFELTAWLSKMFFGVGYAITGHGPVRSEVRNNVIQARVTDAEDFLEGLKDSGIVDRNRSGQFAGMSPEQKKSLVTLKLRPRSSKPYQRIYARRAIVAYADRYGYEAALAFKDALLQPRHHWIDGRREKKRLFKLLSRNSQPKGPGLMAFKPENLKRMGAFAVLEKGLKSAGHEQRTLENVAPHLLPDDLSALNEQRALFSDNRGGAQIGDLLQVPGSGGNSVSDGQNQQKIRDLMLLATAKEAAAAKTEQRKMNLVSLNSLKTTLLAAAMGGPKDLRRDHNKAVAKEVAAAKAERRDPNLDKLNANLTAVEGRQKELAERYNEEMAKLALPLKTLDGPRALEVRASKDHAETYRPNFQESVSQWSKRHEGRLIGLPELKEISAEVIDRINAQMINQKKLDEQLKNNGVPKDLQGLGDAALEAYRKNLTSLVAKESNKGKVLDDKTIQTFSGMAAAGVKRQHGVLNKLEFGPDQE